MLSEFLASHWCASRQPPAPTVMPPQGWGRAGRGGAGRGDAGRGGTGRGGTGLCWAESGRPQFFALTRFLVSPSRLGFCPRFLLSKSPLPRYYCWVARTSFSYDAAAEACAGRRGLQRVDSSEWTPESGLQRVDSSEWTPASRLQRVDSSKWTPASRLQQVDSSEWTSASGLERVDSSALRAAP